MGDILGGGKGGGKGGGNNTALIPPLPQARRSVRRTNMNVFDVLNGTAL